MRLQPRWYGAAYPAKGEFLASDRPRFAYMVVSVKVARPFESQEQPAKLELEVIRISANHVPVGATIWPFKWDSRAPKKDRAVT
jgi:hypothetical protein